MRTRLSATRLDDQGADRGLRRRSRRPARCGHDPPSPQRTRPSCHRRQHERRAIGRKIAPTHTSCHRPMLAQRLHPSHQRRTVATRPSSRRSKPLAHASARSEGLFQNATAASRAANGTGHRRSDAPIPSAAWLATSSVPAPGPASATTRPLTVRPRSGKPTLSARRRTDRSARPDRQQLLNHEHSVSDARPATHPQGSARPHHARAHQMRRRAHARSANQPSPSITRVAR